MSIFVIITGHKLDELYKLDRELQEHSFNVSSLQEDRVCAYIFSSNGNGCKSC